MHFNKVIASFLVSLATCTLLQAQSFNFKNYTTREGLPSSEVYDIERDKNGFIWFCSDEGVGRFSNGKIETFSRINGLLDNTIFHIVPLGKSELVLTVYNMSVSKIGIDKPNKIRTIKYSNDYSDRINKCTVDGNSTIWLNYNHGLYSKKANDADFSLYHDEYLKSSIHFINSSGSILCSYDNILLTQLISPVKKMEVIVTTNTIEKKYILNLTGVNSYNLNVKSVKFSNGDIGFSIANCFFVLNKDGSYIKKVFEKDIASVLLDAENCLWIGLVNYGVKYFKKGDINSEPLSMLKGNTITSICSDNENGIWLGTLENGIFYSQNKVFKVIENTGIETQNITCIDTTSSQLYVGTRKGSIMSLEFASNNEIKMIKSVENKFSRLLFIKSIKGKLYACFPEVTLAYNSTLSASSIDKMGGGIKSMAIGKDIVYGNINSGIIDCFSNDIMNGISGLKIKSFGIDVDKNGDLLIAGIRGLFIYKNKTLVDFSKTHSLLTNRVDLIHVDYKNRYWVSIKGYGIGIIDGNDFLLIDKNDKFPSFTATSITTSHDTAWIGTNNGLCRIILNSVQKHDYSLESYLESDGLLSNEINKVLLFKNSLIIGTSKGLCYAKTNDIKKEISVQPILAKFITDSSQTEYSNANSTLFKYTINKISLVVESPSYKNFDNIQYHYTLIHDKKNSEYTSGNEFVFEELKSGTYSIRVNHLSAYMNQAVTDKSGAFVSFTIDKPYWQKLWFVLSVLFGLIIIVALIIYIRTRSIQRNAEKQIKVQKLIADYKMNTLQAQMNPHFIFNSLNSIQKYILTNNPEKAYSYLAKFGKLIRFVLETSQNNYIRLSKELEFLDLYMQIEQIRLQNKFEFEIIPNEKVNLELSSIPTMMIQPYIENAIWHGVSHLPESIKGKIWLRIDNKDDNYLTIVIEDNGVGRAEAEKINKTANKPKSLALSITKERLNLVDSTIEIIDLYNNDKQATGTKIVLTLKLLDDN